MTEAVTLLKIHSVEYDFSIKKEDIHLKVFNMIKVINESKTLVDYISYEYRYEFDGSLCNSKRKWDKNKSANVCAKDQYHRACKEDYAWNT